MKFQRITVILAFLLICVASGSLSGIVSAAVPLSLDAQAENSTTVPTPFEGPTTLQTVPVTSLTATASLTTPTTDPTTQATTTVSTVPTTTVTTQTTAPTTTVTTQTTAPTTTVTTQTTVPTTTVTTQTTAPTTTVQVTTTLPTQSVTNVTYQSQTTTVSIVQTLNYTPTTYPVDFYTSRTPDIDAGMQPYDGPVPPQTTEVQTVTPINASTPVIVAPANASVAVPVRTFETLTNISNASPYQTYTPAPTPSAPQGSDLLRILLLAVLALAGGGGIALLSRSYRGRQQEPEEGGSAISDAGVEGVAAGAVSAEGRATLDQIAEYDPATTEVEHLMQMLNRLVLNSQKSLHNPSIRLDRLVRLSGISTLPIPEQVAQWGADHGYVVVSRDFQNEALLFRQTPVSGEPDLGIMYIGDLIADNEVPPAPERPEPSRDLPNDR